MRVRKYGGSSLATSTQIMHIAKQLADLPPMILVLSAPYGRTNALYDALKGVGATASPAMNHCLSLGELESCYLMQSALHHVGHGARVLNHLQIGIEASALHGGYIAHVDPSFILSVLESGTTAIVPGFQGRYGSQLAILSRGASDETAIALASSLSLPCEVYSNITHIHSAQGNPLDHMDYDHLLSLITDDQRPMSRRSILLAQKHQTPLYLRHWSALAGGTEVV